MELFTTQSTSANSAETDLIILRETNTTRLVFRPLLVSNPNDHRAAMKGWFVYQKKGRNGGWADDVNTHLSSLRSGQQVSLELKAEELHRLISHVAGLYRLYKEYGLPRGKTHFLKLFQDGGEEQGLSSLDFQKIRRIAKSTGVDVLAEFLDWLAGVDEAGEVIGHLGRLHIDSLNRINSLVGASTLRAVLQKWEDNQDNQSEQFWQDTFREHAFILGQVFAYPVVIIGEKCYVGGKGYTNRSGNVIDFLLSNELTRSAVLVEIKTPTTKLLRERPYREGGAYPASEHLSGAIAQVLTYKQSFVQKFDSIPDLRDAFEACTPHCLVVIGHLRNQLKGQQVQSFELLRGALGTNVTVLTFDELFGRVQALLELIEGTNA